MPDHGRISVLQASLVVVSMRIIAAVLVPAALGSAKRDAWMGELVIQLANQVMLLVTLVLISRFPGKPLVSLCRSALGGFCGTLVGVVYAVFLIHISAGVMRSFADFLLASIMPQTPISLVLLALGLVAAFGARHGIEPLGRVIQSLFLAMFVGMGLILFPLLTEARLERLVPVLENGPGPLWRGVLVGAPLIPEVAFLPTLTALLYNRKGMYGSMHGALLLSGVMISFLAAVVVAVLGDHLSITSQYAGFELARQVAIGDFFDRIDALYMTVVVMGYFIRTACFLYFSSFTTAEVMGLADYRPLVLPILTLVLPLAVLQWGSVMEFKVSYVGRTLPPLGWLMELVLPAVILLVAGIRQRLAGRAVKHSS